MTEPTIVCVSANPALDRRLRVSTFAAGEVNRAHQVQALPGGKAAHVAMASRALGARTVWVGFLGSAIGEQCADELRRLEIAVLPIRTRSATRVNLEVIEDSGRITEVLEPGTAPTLEERDEMLRACTRGLLQDWKGAALAISGSLPSGMPDSFYRSLIEIGRAAGSKVFLDTSGDALRASLTARPTLAKCNRKEAEELVGHPVSDFPSAVEAARAFLSRGAESAAITLGDQGMVWIESHDGPTWIARPPRLQAISTVGCGDATLAGFARASLQGITGEEALRFITACGAANCLAELEGRISAKDVVSLIPRIEISRYQP